MLQLVCFRRELWCVLQEGAGKKMIRMLKWTLVCFGKPCSADRRAMKWDISMPVSTPILFCVGEPGSAGRRAHRWNPSMRVKTVKLSSNFIGPVDVYSIIDPYYTHGLK